MGLLGALLDARIGESFEGGLHPRDREGRFRDKPGNVTRRGARQRGAAKTLAEVKARHPHVQIDAHEKPDGIVLSMIRTTDTAQGTGKASAALDELLRHADAHGKTVALTPEQVGRGGLSTTALRKWYGSRGFVPNKGRAKDFAFTQSYIRAPKS